MSGAAMTHRHWTRKQLADLYGRTSPDTREMWDERAAIMEYDGGLSRLEAENAAHLSTVDRIKIQIERLISCVAVLHRMDVLQCEELKKLSLDPELIYEIAPNAAGFEKELLGIFRKFQAIMLIDRLKSEYMNRKIMDFKKDILVLSEEAA